MEPFRFKQFQVRHDRSSMRIGVDSVNLGAWADLASVRTVLDVGTGCGIIALMCAQRNAEAEILAVDLHPESVEQARENFMESPWSDRLRAVQQDFMQVDSISSGYDLIISNPPYFHSGVKDITTARERARHQAGLSPMVLIERSASLLSHEGRLAMVVPSDQEDEIKECASRNALYLSRLTKVKARADLPAKRLLIEFRLIQPEKVEETELILETSPGNPTDEYRKLCSGFYLYF